MHQMIDSSLSGVPGAGRRYLAISPSRDCPSIYDRSGRWIKLEEEAFVVSDTVRGGAAEQTVLAVHGPDLPELSRSAFQRTCLVDGLALDLAQ